MKKYAKEFVVSTAPQRSPQWYAERAGIPSASGLGWLFSTTLKGEPTADAKKYLKQLAFERKFGVTYDNYETEAMAAGTYYEDFARQVYRHETGNLVNLATSYVSDWFVATPDGHVVEKCGKRGLWEGKVLRDNAFMDVIENGLPLKFELQGQGQMLASGVDWVDFTIVNLKTRAYINIRLERNNKLIKRIYERLHEPLDLPDIDTREVKRFDPSLLDKYVGEQGLPATDLVIKNLPF